jgi:hypothetical protein
VLLVGLTAAAALYTHYLALFAVAALALLSLLSGRYRTGLALLAAFALFLPWLPVLLEQPSEALAWSRERPEAAFAGFLSALGGAGRVPAPFGPPLPPPLFFAGLLPSVALVFLLLRRPTAGEEAGRGALFVILVLAAILLASLWRPLAFAGRSEMVVLPVWLWTISAAGERSRLLRCATWATALIAAAASLFVLASPRPVSGPAQAVRLVSSALRPGDRLVAGAGFYLPARLAADRGEIAAELHPFPAEVGRHPGWFVPTAPTAEDYAAVSRATAAARARIFFLLPHSYRTTELLAILTGRGTLREAGAEAEGVVLIWEPGRQALSVKR